MAKLKTKGFSLIEMVAYVAILGLILVVVTEVLISIVHSQRLIETVRGIDNSALGMLERVEREVRVATSIDTSSSVLGTNPGKLVLTSATTTWEFYLSAGQVRVKQNGVDQGALTEASTTVTDLIFTRFATSTFEGVKTKITLESGTSTAYRSETFYSSATIR